MAETLNSLIDLTLGNVPDINLSENQELYEAFLKIHQAIEIIVDYYDEVGGLYVTIGDPQTITGEKTFNAATIFSDLATFNAAIAANGNITIADAINIILDTTTGTKIGTATSQKLGFWNAAPVVQPAAALQAALTNSTGGTQDGTLAAVAGSGADAAINDNFTDIHALLNEIRTALVAVGIIKGSA